LCALVGQIKDLTQDILEGYLPKYHTVTEMKILIRWTDCHEKEQNSNHFHLSITE